MRWIVKAAVQNVLAVAPKGREINYVMQRSLTRTLPGDDNHFRVKARKALWHFAAVQRHLRGVERGLRFYEFGAGWDLIVPLVNYGLGVDDQVVVDVEQLVHLDLVEHSIRKYTAHMSELESTSGRPLRPLGDPSVRSLPELNDRFGIRYMAPCDPRATGLPSNSVDFVSSTGTLQHIPVEQICPILEECRRLLRPGGVISCHIEMPDGYTDFDRTLSPYHFLKFSDRTWALINSPFYFLNRLRARDYVELFERAGFDIAERAGAEPTENDVTELRGMRLARRFRRYTLHELAIQQLSLVAVNP